VREAAQMGFTRIVVPTATSRLTKRRRAARSCRSRT
jgi:hypothetical protein